MRLWTPTGFLPQVPELRHWGTLWPKERAKMQGHGSRWNVPESLIQWLGSNPQAQRAANCLSPDLYSHRACVSSVGPLSQRPLLLTLSQFWGLWALPPEGPSPQLLLCQHLCRSLAYRLIIHLGLHLGLHLHMRSPCTYASAQSSSFHVVMVDPGPTRVTTF